MVNRAYIIHGWGGNPQEGWFPWLKAALEKKQWDVVVPLMPNPSHPTIEAWVAFLSEVATTVNEGSLFIGHSIGCQAIVRFVETLNFGTKVGGIELVAPWMSLLSYEAAEEKAIAKPWETTPIDFPKVRAMCPHVSALFSDNDPFVGVENEKLFKEKLGAKTQMLHAHGHFSGSDGVTELPEVLQDIDRMRR